MVRWKTRLQGAGLARSMLGYDSRWTSPLFSSASAAWRRRPPPWRLGSGVEPLPDGFLFFFFSLPFLLSSFLPPELVAVAAGLGKGEFPWNLAWGFEGDDRGIRSSRARV